MKLFALLSVVLFAASSASAHDAARDYRFGYNGNYNGEFEILGLGLKTKFDVRRVVDWRCEKLFKNDNAIVKCETSLVNRRSNMFGDHVTMYDEIKKQLMAKFPGNWVTEPSSYARAHAIYNINGDKLSLSRSADGSNACITIEQRDHRDIEEEFLKAI